MSIPVKVRMKFLLMVAKDQCPARRVRGTLTRSRSALIFQKSLFASTPRRLRMSGREWLRIIEYHVVQRASGVLGLMTKGFGWILACRGAGAAGVKGVAMVVVSAFMVEVEAIMVGITEDEVVSFFFFPCFVTVAQVSPKGLPARGGNLAGPGIGISDKGWKVGMVLGSLMVAMGGSEKWTFELARGAPLGLGSE
jgi:hypothetical protein